MLRFRSAVLARHSFGLLAASIVVLAVGTLHAQGTRPAKTTPDAARRGGAPTASLAAGAIVSASASTAASSAAAAPGSATAPGSAPAPEPRATLASTLAEQAARIRDLLAQRLDPAVDPQSLFDVALDDKQAVQLEAARLELLLRAADAGAPRAPRGKASAKGAASAKPARQEAPPARQEAPDAGAGSGEAAEAKVDPAELAARIDLDRARLTFYRLEPTERQRLLAAHVAQQTSGDARAEQQLSDADRRSRDAERQRQKALEAARAARTEALRMVAEEQARLLSVAQRQAEFEKALLRRRTELRAHDEQVLGWHRRVREAVTHAGHGDMPSEDIDALYADLRAELRASRDRLSTAIAAATASSEVPAAGADPLGALPPEVDRSAPRAKRREVEAEAERLRKMEEDLRDEAFRSNYRHVVDLNTDRLALYPFLGADLRSQIVGFGATGLDQARAEIRQVVLVLRHHAVDTRRFVTTLTKPGTARNTNALAVALVLLEWLIPISVFVWWRRRAASTLTALEEAAKEQRRKSRKVQRSTLERALAFVRRVRRPVEWLVLLACVVALLPAAARSLLEVQLPVTIFGWTLGGAAVVSALDALMGSDETRSHTARTAQLRLRSLRLVGRVVVSVGLILGLTDQLVGRGTIYAWVLSTCWFAALPITLVLVRWWRATIFERIQQKRKKSAFDAWVLRHDAGYKSMAAALAGGAVLLATGIARTLRHWAAGFDFTRRVLAYLFRRDMSRRAEGTVVHYQRLENDLFRALGPSVASEEIVPSVADEEVARVIDRINSTGGGVFAVVGERGSGKTTLLQRIASGCADVTLLQCPVGDADAFTGVLATAVGLDPGATIDDCAEVMDRDGRDAGLLIDDAHRLILPMMGGLDAFDRVLAVARRRSANCSWVFAFDVVIWRFFERARGSRPLFDEVIHLQPWREEGITRLLISRSGQTGIAPSFANLITGLPEDADEIDTREATERTAQAYYRLIWDYASGNPGIALHAWRLCLGKASDGSVAVRVFDAPDTRDLEVLPDNAVFVLRAVVQLELASPEDIARVTMLGHSEVHDTLRYGLTRGYFALRDGRYWITWAWFRPVTRLLQRRYLLPSN